VRRAVSSAGCIRWLDAPSSLACFDHSMMRMGAQIEAPPAALFSSLPLQPCKTIWSGRARNAVLANQLRNRECRRARRRRRPPRWLSSRGAAQPARTLTLTAHDSEEPLLQHRRPAPVPSTSTALISLASASPLRKKKEQPAALPLPWPPLAARPDPAHRAAPASLPHFAPHPRTPRRAHDGVPGAAAAAHARLLGRHHFLLVVV